jgi:hypothetical protein
VPGTEVVSLQSPGETPDEADIRAASESTCQMRLPHRVKVRMKALRIRSNQCLSKRSYSTNLNRNPRPKQVSVDMRVNLSSEAASQ